jgi:hypothetical protein
LRMTTSHRAIRVALFSCVILVAFSWHSVRAVERPALEYLAGESQREDARYFVDFHARGRPSLLGHVFIVYGELNPHGRIVEAQVVGFTPDTNKYWAAYFIPFRGLLGRRRADLTEPSTVVYRRHLTVAEYQQLIAKVRQVRAIHPFWHLIFSNCNNFMGEIAKSIGLLRPFSLLPPSIYVSFLRALNHS